MSVLDEIGQKTDAKSTATDSTSVTAMQVWKQISASVQTVAAGASIVRPTTFSSVSDVTLTNASETALVAADSTRREAILVADEANTVGIRLGETGSVGASRGAKLLPGASVTITTTAAIYGYASTSGQKVSISLVKD